MADNWWSNPAFKKFASEGLQDLGYGLSNSTNIGNAFGAATNRMQQMEPYRAEMAQQEEAEAKLAEQGNVTRSWLEQQGYTDLVPLVDAGQADIAYSEALKRMQPGYGAGPAPLEVGGVLLDPNTYEPIFDSRTPEKPPAAPSGYQWNQDGTQTYVRGGPADPAFATPKPPTDAERRGAALTSVVDSDAALLLGDGGANPGVFDQLADSGDQFWNAGTMGVNPLKGFSSPEYQKAANAVENIAQSYLYAISGQAAPAAEVEKIINSITPRPFENPAVLAEKKRRLEEYVNAIRMSAGNHSSVTGGNAGDGWEVVGVQ